MNLWTTGQMLTLRDLRKTGRPMADIVPRCWPHTREEVVEAIDSLIRSDTVNQACDRVNHILLDHEDGTPLINGKPAKTVEAGRRPIPMF